MSSSPPPLARAAISEIATILGPVVTNAIIEDFADELGLLVSASNKIDKIRALLELMCRDGRRHQQAGNFVVHLTMEGYARALQSKCEFFVEDVDRIVAAMARLDLRVESLARQDWRTGMARRSQTAPQTSGQTRTNSSIGPAPSPSVRSPRTYGQALEHIGELSADGVNPQHRGRQLEFVLLDILKAEGLSPEHRIVIAGEELDLAFSIGSHHYLAECKWERDPLGLPPIHTFTAKVSRKAEGTFGVVLSMSGFVRDVNEKASRGGRLTAVGLGPMHLMNVLEGRATWTQTVERARQEASRRSLFFVPL